MARTAFIGAAIVIAVAVAPASAQMGGSMSSSGPPGQSSSKFDKDKLTSGDKKKWAVCQEMAAEAMAQDKKCVRLQKKVERAAAKQM